MFFAGGVRFVLLDYVQCRCQSVDGWSLFSTPFWGCSVSSLLHCVGLLGKFDCLLVELCRAGTLNPSAYEGLEKNHAASRIEVLRYVCLSRIEVLRYLRVQLHWRRWLLPIFFFCI